MSTPKPSAPVAGAPATDAPALPERQLTALRSYLLQLTGGDARRVAVVTKELLREAQAAGNGEFADDPSVWLFLQGRRRVMGAGQRSDGRMSAPDESRGEEEVGAEGEDLRIVVHNAIRRLTPKQQEALRLKFQFGFNLEELARITGLTNHGAGGLLHLAVNRVGQAICAASGSEAPPVGDQQLTAYALDELDEGEQKTFIESVPNGQALLEGAAKVRAWCGQIGQVLESGAQLPQRRRSRKGTPWWKRKSIWLALAALLVTGGGIYLLRPAMTRAATTEPLTGANGIGAMRGERGSPSGGTGGTSGIDRKAGGELASAGVRPPRNSPQSWETKPFGKGSGSAAGAGGGGGPSFGAMGAGGPASTGGGAKSRGSPSGVTSQARNPAEARGLTGEIEPATNDPAEPPDDEPESLPKPEPEASATIESGSSAVNRPAKIAIHRPLASSHETVYVTEAEAKESSTLAKKVALAALKPGMGELKRQLARKRWPMPAEVSAAEMLKHGPPSSPEPGQSEAVEAQLEQARSPWDPTKRIVRVSLRAKDAPAPMRPAANLVFAIDVSQSMTGPNRLPLVQEGIRRLVDRLRPGDQVSVVTYADKAAVALPATPVGEAGELRSCLAGLEAAGRTNGSEGLLLAYETVRNHWIAGGLNELVLCTDGNFNLGTTDETKLAGLAAEQAKAGVRLSVFGFGRNDRNDLRLELLASSGGGRSCYVNTREEAEHLLVGQINGFLPPVANDVMMQVEFNPALVAEAHRIDGQPGGGAEAGSVALLLPGRRVTALYEITPQPGTGPEGAALATLAVGYTLPGSGQRQQSRLALTGVEQDWARTGMDFRYAVAMMEFARILEGGPAAGRAELDRLEGWTRANLANDTGGYREELLYALAQAKNAATQGRPAAGANR